MRRINVLLFFMFTLVLALPAVDAAPHPAPSIEVVYTLTNINYPGVEIAVTGQDCRSFGIGDIGFYFNIPSNSSLSIEVREELPLSGNVCDGPLLATYNINYISGQYYTVYLYEDTSNDVAVSLFNNDVSAISSGQTRILIRNAVSLQPAITLNLQLPPSHRRQIVPVQLGQQVTMELPAGNWQFSLLNPPPERITLRPLGTIGPFGAGELWIVNISEDAVPDAALIMYSLEYLLP